MKKYIFCVLISIIFLQLNICALAAYALDTGLLDIRNKIFDESKDLKPLIATSTDSVLLSSMWDSSLIIITTIDAYFFMLGIFNAIKDEDSTVESVDYLIGWLNRLKQTNDMNARGLQNIAEITDERIKIHIRTLENYFNELNKLVGKEMGKVEVIKKSIRKR